MAVAMFFWLSYVPIAVLSVIRILQNRGVFVQKNLTRDIRGPTVIFQITTRSATKTPVVARGIKSIVDATRKVGFSNYQICVVTDDPLDVATVEGAEVVLVHGNYKTDAIKKGRALQYAVEHRRRTRKNGKEYWVFHMDDESYVLPQTVLALLKFLREDSQCLAAEGPIFYPLKFESANFITAIAESIRPFACYDCVSQMTRPPPLHMHGSNLLVRSDVEDVIEWKFGPTLAEDQMFGYKVYERYGKGSMGWHGGMLLEQPPLNIKDHFFQRRRWILGTLQNTSKFPAKHRFKLMYKSVTFFMGFASAVASIAISIHNYFPAALSLPQANYKIGIEFINIQDTLRSWFSTDPLHALVNVPPAELVMGAVLLFTSFVWLASYQLGLFFNLKHSEIKWRKRFLFHVQTLLLSPILGLIETFPAFYAFIEYYVRRTGHEKLPVYDFYVVNK